MTKKVHPIEGALATLKVMAFGNRYRAIAITTELAGHTVDTCIAFDTKEWETGVEPKGGKWVIVEQYKGAEEARKGHERWVKTLTEHPETELVDIDLWALKELKE